MKAHLRTKGKDFQEAVLILNAADVEDLDILDMSDQDFAAAIMAHRVFVSEIVNLSAKYRI